MAKHLATRAVANGVSRWRHEMRAAAGSWHTTDAQEVLYPGFATNIRTMASSSSTSAPQYLLIPYQTHPKKARIEIYHMDPPYTYDNGQQIKVGFDIAGNPLAKAVLAGVEYTARPEWFVDTGPPPGGAETLTKELARIVPELSSSSKTPSEFRANLVNWARIRLSVDEDGMGWAGRNLVILRAVLLNNTAVPARFRQYIQAWAGASHRVPDVAEDDAWLAGLVKPAPLLEFAIFQEYRGEQPIFSIREKGTGRPSSRGISQNGVLVFAMLREAKRIMIWDFLILLFNHRSNTVGAYKFENPDTVAHIRLQRFLQSHFGEGSPDAIIYEPIDPEGKRGSRIGTSITMQAAAFLAEAFGRDDITIYLEALRKHTATELLQLPFTGTRDTAERLPDLLRLKEHVHHLATLTYSPSVTNANADGDLNIVAFRNKVAKEAENVRWHPVQAVIRMLDEDPIVTKECHRSATLLLPIDDTRSAVLKYFGTFLMGETDTRPRGACNACTYTEKLHGVHSLLVHIRESHGSEAAFNWEKVASCWEIYMYNLDTGYVQDFKSPYKMHTYVKASDHIGLGDAESPRLQDHFARKGDRIFWYLSTSDRPQHHLLEALSQLWAHPEYETMYEERFILETHAFLDYIIQDNGSVMRGPAHGKGYLSDVSVINLLASYGYTASLMQFSGWHTLLSAVLGVLARPYVETKLNFFDVSGKRVLEGLFSAVFKTFTLASLPNREIVKFTGMQGGRTFTIILIFRRTRGGGLILVGVVVVCRGAFTLNTLKRFVGNGHLRHSLIAGDLQIPAEAVPYKAILLNGLKANTDKAPEDGDIMNVTEVEGFDFPFDDQNLLLDCRGFMPDGSEVLLSISGWDGFLCRPTAILQFFDNWTGGMLVHTVSDRVAQGFTNPNQSGTLHQVYVPIPAFCQYLVIRAADEEILCARRSIEQTCATQEERDYQETIIRVAEAKKVKRIGRDLTPSEISLFECVLEAYEVACNERDILKSTRNTVGSKVLGSGPIGRKHPNRRLPARARLSTRFKKTPPEDGQSDFVVPDGVTESYDEESEGSNEVEEDAEEDWDDDDILDTVNDETLYGQNV